MIVLLAEDNEVNRELLREVLESRGYSVVEACDGQQALERLADGLPAVLLLDLQMPVLNGFDVLREVRQRPGGARLPVIAVTAYAMATDRERIANAGFNACVIKPVDFPQLFAEIERLTAARHVEHMA